MLNSWRPGDVILERHTFDGDVTIARSVRVVAREREMLVTWIVPGSDVAVPNERVPPYTGTHVRPWEPPGMLQIVREGEAHALALLRDGNDRFAGWYVNLQEPLSWTARGYDTRDNLLDLWRPADGDWRWKDEHELELAVSRRCLTRADAEAVRAEAQRVIDADPIPTGWEDFVPEPSWRASKLPPGWDVP